MLCPLPKITVKIWEHSRVKQFFIFYKDVCYVNFEVADFLILHQIIAGKWCHHIPVSCGRVGWFLKIISISLGWRFELPSPFSPPAFFFFLGLKIIKIQKNELRTIKLIIWVYQYSVVYIFKGFGGNKKKEKRER